MQEVNTPLVSIGIPTYNRSKLLEQNILNLLKQEYRNIEIIISDNHSTDNTEIVCKNLSKKYKNIRYFKQKKQIPALENFNYTLSKSKGDFFMWASDDDMWHPNFISDIMREYNKSEDYVVLIASKFRIIDEHGNLKKNKNVSFLNFTNKYLSFEDYLKEDMRSFKTCIFYGIYRANTLKESNGYVLLPALSASDYLTIHKIMTKGRVKIVNKVRFFKREKFYTDKFENISSVPKALLYFDIFTTILSIIEKIVFNFLPQNLIFLLRNVYLYYSFNDNLIQDYFGNSIRLKLINILSSIELFAVIIPNDINELKKRNVIFYGKTI